MVEYRCLDLISLDTCSLSSLPPPLLTSSPRSLPSINPNNHPTTLTFESRSCSIATRKRNHHLCLDDRACWNNVSKLHAILPTLLPGKGTACTKKKTNLQYFRNWNFSSTDFFFPNRSIVKAQRKSMNTSSIDTNLKSTTLWQSINTSTHTHLRTYCRSLLYPRRSSLILWAQLQYCVQKFRTTLTYVGVNLRSIFMFFNFYRLDLLNETRVVYISESMMETFAKIGLKIGPPLLALVMVFGSARMLIDDFLTGHIHRSSQLCSLLRVE
jgi:hypothetical protein